MGFVIGQHEVSTRKKWLRGALIAIFGIYAFYLLAVHLLIATPLLRHFANKSPEKFKLEYGSAWSVFPGRVHVRGLQLRIRISDAEVYVSSDRVYGTISLFALTKKTIKAHDLQASGMTVRVRPRFDREDLKPLTMEGYAEIPGFDEPPFRSQKPRELTDVSGLWTIDLQRVNADTLRELWIGPYRFAGDARITGGVFIKPLREFELWPSTMEIRSGVLTLAKRPFSSDVKGTLEASIARHNPKAVDGTEMFRHLSGKVDLGSAIDDVGFVQRWLVPEANVQVSGGSGAAQSKVAIVNGVFQDGSTLIVKGQKMLVRHAPLSAWLDSDVVLRADQGALRMTAKLTELRIARRYAESYPIKSDQLVFTAVTRSLDLARKPFDDLLVSVDLQRATLTDLRILTGLLGKDLTLAGGVAYVKAHLDLSVREMLLQGELSFDAPKFAAKMTKPGEVAFAAKVSVGARFKSFDLSAMTASVPHAWFDMRDAVVTGEAKEPPPSWWGRLDLLHGTLDKAQKPAFAGDLEMRARDARPIIYIATAKNPLPNWVREPVAMEGLTVGGKLHVGPGFAVENLNGGGGGIDVSGRVKQVGSKTDGHVTLSYGALSFTVNLAPKEGVGGGPKP